MDAIDVIIEKINEQGNTERNDYKNNRLAEIETNYLVEERKINQDHELQLARQTEQVHKQAQQRINRLTVEARQDALKKKQSYLERLFDEVAVVMAEWSIEETQAFAFGVLKTLQLKQATFIPGGLMDSSIFTTEWITETAKKLDMSLTLAPTSKTLEYGFLVEHEGVQYNFFYRDLLLEERKNKGREFMQVLFS